MATIVAIIFVKTTPHENGLIDIYMFCTPIQMPEVCAFQEPANYSISILDETNHVVTSSYSKPAISTSTSGIIMETFSSGISKGANYTVKLTLNHFHFTGEVIFNRTAIGENTIPTLMAISKTNFYVNSYSLPGHYQLLHQHHHY